MQRLRLVGALWLALAVFSIAMTLIFRVDQSQIVVTMLLGIATVLLGLVALARPSREAITASLVAGIAWLAIYAALTVIQADDPAAFVTDAGLAVGGGAIALLAWSARVALGPENAFRGKRTV